MIKKESDCFILSKIVFFIKRNRKSVIKALSAFGIASILMLFQALPTKSAIVYSAPEMFEAVETMTAVVTTDEENACVSSLENEKLTEAKTTTEENKINADDFGSLSEFGNSGLPISELDIPEDLNLDENGIPENYAYCVEAKATAYTGDPATASGRTPMPGHIAVDPKEYPYGTELYVVSADGKYIYGYCVAADTGGFVKMGNTDIDVYLDNEDMCDDWGNREVKIYVLNKE